ncbi:TIGR03089 family protein [Arthrobacter monumenti]
MKSTPTVAALLTGLRQNRASSPRLIWYGPGGERVELSGRVLDNWVAKTANLMVDDLDAEEDTTILLDMPPHWRSLCWALAGWQTGATIRLDSVGEAASSDLIVTTQPEHWGDDVKPPQYLVAVALGALDMKWNGELPADALDYASEVRSHADEYLGLSGPADDGTALEFGSRQISHKQLLAGYAGLSRGSEVEPGRTPEPAAETVLIHAGLGMPEVLRLALGTWATDGAVVLVHPSVEVSDSLVSSERITRRFDDDPGL